MCLDVIDFVTAIALERITICQKSMDEHLFRYATELKSYDILQAFLNHGWDINTPVDSLNLPALAYVTALICRTG
jgi:hypothetical protein